MPLKSLRTLSINNFFLFPLFFIITIMFILSVPVMAESDSKVTAVYPQPSHTFVLTEAGSLWAWGDNQYGKLGDGTGNNRSIPFQLILDNIASIYPQSSGHTFALKNDGTLWAWERNWDGRIGAGNENPDFFEPIQILDNVAEVFPHERHSFALKTDGTLWAWGHNNNGQLGDGTRTSRLSPVQVELQNVVEVVPGNGNTFAILEDGSLWGWGHNQYGKLGDGSTMNRFTPIRILDDVKSIHPQDTHTLAHKNDGTLWAWGYNFYGQLGDGSNNNQRLPVQVSLSDVEELYPQRYHALAKKGDGSLWAWGYNWYGQLGDGSISNRNQPVQIDLQGISQVYAQEHHTFTLLNDQTLWGWGRNWDGRLGEGSNNHIRSAPVKVADNIEKAFIQERHAFALDSQGYMLGWGENNKSQLGTGSGSGSGEPIDISLDSVSEIYPQDSHTFALREDGSLWAWGNNTKGQLGLGNYERQSAPAQVLLGDDLPLFSISLSANPHQGGALDGAGSYRRGASVTVGVTVNEGFYFINWTEDGEVVSSERFLTFLAMRDRNLVANFRADGEESPQPAAEEPVEEPEEEPVLYKITLRTEPEESGTVTDVSGEGSYEEGAAVSIKAVSAEGYRFLNWTAEGGSVVSGAASFEYTMPAENVTLTANFEKIPAPTYELTLEANPEAGGSVSGDGEYKEGAEINITASADDGYQFVNWTDENGDQISDTAGFVYNMPAKNIALTANFEEEEPVISSPVISEVDAENGKIQVTFSEPLNEAPAMDNFKAWYIYYPGTDLENEESEDPGEDENGIPDSENNEQVELESKPDLTELVPNNLGLVTVSWDEEMEDIAILTFSEFEPQEEEISYTVSVSYLDDKTVSAEPFIVDALPEEPETFTLNLLAAPETGGSVSGSGEYEEGAGVPVSATANAGYEFVNWTNEDNEAISDEAEYVYTMTAENVALTANFTEIEEEPELFLVTYYTNPEESGYITHNGNSGEVEYEAGTTLTFTAHANDNYEFVGWKANNETVGTNLKLQYLMPAEDVNLAAYFSEAPPEPEEDRPEPEEDRPEPDNGTENDEEPVDPQPAEFFNIDVETEQGSEGKVYGAGVYEKGETTTITAEAPPGYSFYCWMENDDMVSFDKDYSFEVQRDRLLLARFEDEDAARIYDITLSISPEGGGTAQGSGVYGHMDKAKFIAIPNEDYTFKHWTENGTVLSTDSEFDLIVVNDHNLIAHFEFDEPIDTESEEENGGSQPSNDQNEDDTSNETSNQTLRKSSETPDSEPETLYTIELLVEPEDSGIVDGNGEYVEGALVGLNAIPAEGYAFAGWIEDEEKISLARTYAFFVEGDRTLTATFEPLLNRQNEYAESYRVSLAPTPLEGGRVYGGGIYTEGETVTISALPNMDYHFLNWIEDGKVISNNIIYTFTVDREYRLEARFVPIFAYNYYPSGDGYEDFDRFLAYYFADFLIPDLYHNGENSQNLNLFGWAGIGTAPAGGGDFE